MSDVDRIIELIRDWHRELATDETGAEEHVEALVEHALRDLVAERDAARATVARVEFLASRWAVTRAATSTTYVATMIRAAIAGDERAAAAEIGGQS